MDLNYEKWNEELVTDYRLDLQIVKRSDLKKACFFPNLIRFSTKIPDKVYFINSLTLTVNSYFFEKDLFNSDEIYYDNDILAQVKNLDPFEFYFEKFKKVILKANLLPMKGSVSKE